MVELQLVFPQRCPTLRELEHSMWRNEFPTRTRWRICNLIENLFIENLRGNHLIDVLPTIVKEFETKIFSMAESEVDYLKKIIFKLVSVVGEGDQNKNEMLGPHQNNPELGAPLTMWQVPMPQNPFCNAVPVDVQKNPAMMAPCNGNGNFMTYTKGLDWQAETFQKIIYLKQTYGERLFDVYSWAKSGPQKEKRNIIGPGVLKQYMHEMRQIANLLLLKQKETITMKMIRSMPDIEENILFYLDVKESSDSSEEIYSNLETSEPDTVEEFTLNVLIKAFLLDRSKKLGVYIHLVDDESVDRIISCSVRREIVEIMNEWCDHKINILIQGQPTMEETERELSLWSTPGSDLQYWDLLKHLPMRIGPRRPHADPMFQRVCSIWKMPDAEPQLSQFKQYNLWK